MLTISRQTGRGAGVRLALALAVVLVLVAACASSAFAVGAGAHLTAQVLPLPTHFTAADDAACEKGGLGGHGPGEEIEPCDVYQVMVTNLGARAATGPIVVTDTLPEGITPIGVIKYFFFQDPQSQFSAQESGEGPSGRKLNSEVYCKTEGVPVSVTCELPPSVGELGPDYRLELDIEVTVAEDAVNAPDEASVFENGVMVASVKEDDDISLQTPPFGTSRFLFPIVSDDGTPDRQAGDHPFGLSTTIDPFTTMGLEAESARVEPTTVGELRDVVVDLPPGFAGSAVAAPKCTYAQLQSFPTSCPENTIVGKVTTEPLLIHGADVNSPVFNMVPKKGVVAEFGFTDLLHHTHTIVATVAPTPEGYVARAISREIPDIALTDIISPFYGFPAERYDKSHLTCTWTGNEASKYQNDTCTEVNGSGEGEYELEPSNEPEIPMFTMPADCSGEPLKTRLFVDSWLEPAAFSADDTPADLGEPAWKESVAESPPVTGCDQLRFVPELFSAKPDTSSTDSPTGLSFELKLPQPENANTLGTPPLRDTSVTLPAGLIPNPAAAAGLTGCSEAQIGWLGSTGPHGEALPNQGLTNFTAAAPECPAGSTTGAVEVSTPLLEKPVVGEMYLASQDENPFGSILAGYIVIDDPTTGVIVKLPGRLTLDPHTGQVTGVFDEAPQMPFSDLKLRFFGGERGKLATPTSCGTFTTSGLLTPWSAPDSGPPVSLTSSFEVSSGCTPAFGPTFTAGTTNTQAGAYSPFVLSFSRQDSEQELSSLTVTLPPGLTAKIAGVGKCTTAQLQQAASDPSAAAEIANPACPASSEIGTVESGAGVGPNPFFLTGKAYLTEGYKGAPLGLAVIVPVLAGPLDLGNVVVRTALYINPNDAHVTAVSDPFPTIIDATGNDGITDGFVDRLRSINVTLNRSSYILNPTSCSQMTIGASFTSTAGATSSPSSRFQASGCQELPFKPTFTASTVGHASKANGASLTVHVTSGPGQANIAKTKVQLPKQLPSWLPTLQKACLASVFEANPAACPPASLVGTATAKTPLLSTPFSGPAYLVSHGAAAFPDLEIVLQSEGITIVLDGKTDIKHGITTSYFETLPDAPVSSFELTIPTGPNHLIATNIPEKLNHNLCGQKLEMPTVITGQNGAVVKQTTKIATTGCPKPKAKHKKKKKSKKKHNTKKKH